VSRLPIREQPYNAETLPDALIAPRAPAGAHYVRSNFAAPSLEASTYALQVEGAVAQPLRLTLDALRAMPTAEHVVTMECAGNDRLGLRPLPAGEPWASGAVATASWRGVPLAEVLRRAGVQADACEVLAIGADAGPREDATPDDVAIDAAEDAAIDPMVAASANQSTPPGEGHVVRFARSLPLDVALHPDTLLAFDMNGAPLPPEHGAPLRLVVPGWYGMANVKWVERLSVRTTPFTGYFQRRRYMYEEAAGATPVTRARVKSMITTPVEGTTLPTGAITVRGWAWSGDAPIVRVEVNVGGGDTWHEATLGAPEGPYAWTPFACEVTSAHHGRVVLASRATDARGATQPDVVAWNRLGYGNHAVRPVVVQVASAG